MNILSFSKLFGGTLCVAAASLCITSCSLSSKVVEASDNIISRPVDNVTGFSNVKSGNSLVVNIATGSNYSVSVSGPDNIVDYVVTSVSGSTLDIGFRENINVDYRSPENRVVVTVTMPTLSALSATGQSTMNVSGDVNGEFRASASGQARIFFSNAIEAPSATLDASGQSEINVPGVISPSATVTASGQASVQIKSVESPKLCLSTSGQSSLTVDNTMATVTVAESSGQSSIGLPSLDGTSVSADASGQSSINITTSTASVTSSTSGQANVTVRKP